MSHNSVTLIQGSGLPVNTPKRLKMAIKTLRDCHWNFRLAGAYRESAIASLCEGVILAMDPEKADDGVIFDITFPEMQTRVERSWQST